jgi:signal transduction histidine kinase
MSPPSSRGKTMASNDTTVVRSIVLIDDDADFLHVVERRLQSQQAEYSPSGPVKIHTFSDPLEATVNLPADGICVVFIDYNMPGCTGLDFIPSLIKANVGPVILLTNQNDAKIAAAAFRAGISDYIAKADIISDDQRLGRTIREAVNRYRLEARNSTLTRELKLVNVELEAKNERLKELTETAHHFVDDVAHDLRTPLTVIDQYASILAEGLCGAVTPRQVKHLETISEATHDMAEMVDDFLDSSKLKARALSVDRAPHTVQELFDSVIPLLEIRAKPKGVSIRQSPADDVGKFFGDLSKTGRVLINLAVNAIKVSPQDGSIELSAATTDAGDVRIAVTDQGPGMRPEDLDVIFERFKQLEEPQLAGTKGFGLGLSIVKQLTWLNLGAVDVQSEPGKGSTFGFTLPGDDLSRILARFTDCLGVLEEIGEVRLLHIGAAPDADVATLRRVISSSCRPMDLVLEDPEENAVNVVGVSRDTTAWSNKIRDAMTRFNRSIERQAPELEIKVGGSWSRDSDKAQLHTALLEALSARMAHV